MRKKKYAVLAAAILLFVSISAFLFWRSTHAPIFPDTDGRVVSITAYRWDCVEGYRKDLSAPEAVAAAMEQLRPLTYNPHKEDVYGPNPGGRVIRLVLRYESREEPRIVSLAQGGTVIFGSEEDPIYHDDPQYCMPPFNVETLWDSFDAPAVFEGYR